MSQKELIPLMPGEVLRYERKQRGLTIESAARQFRINPAILTAIESGETGDIPSVYLKGYIRNYARSLGVDPGMLEDQMEHVRGAEPRVQTVFTVKTRRGRAEKWFKASSYLAASALIATLAWQFTHQAVRFSQGDPKLSTGTVQPSDSGEPDAQQEAVETRQANTHLNASIASAGVVGQNGRLRGDSAAEQAWAAIASAPETDSAAVSDANVLAIRTSADTWVEITDARGRQLELDLIRAGNSREYSGEAPFEIMIGRASSVVLNMDGQTVDLGPHTRGNVARMTLQPQ